MQALQKADATSSWTADDFECSMCNQLLYNPVVLNCGHAVCQATCRPWVHGSCEPACPRCKATVVSSPAVCAQVDCVQWFSYLSASHRARSMYQRACTEPLNRLQRSQQGHVVGTVPVYDCWPSHVLTCAHSLRHRQSNHVLMLAH